MIYFIAAPGTGLIKIGFTNKQPDHRLQILQIGSPIRLKRVALMTGEKEIEGRIHWQFRHLREHGEWFRDTVEIRRYIADNAETWERRDNFHLLTEEKKEARAAQKAAKMGRHSIAINSLYRDKDETPSESVPCPAQPTQQPIATNPPIQPKPSKSKRDKKPRKIRTPKPLQPRPLARRDPWAMLPPAERKNSFDLAALRRRLAATPTPAPGPPDPEGSRS